MTYVKLLIRRVQRGHGRRAKTSVAAEDEGIDGDEGTEAGTSLAVSLSMANQSKEYPVSIPKRGVASDQNTSECKRAEEFGSRRPNRAPTI